MAYQAQIISKVQEGQKIFARVVLSQRGGGSKVFIPELANDFLDVYLPLNYTSTDVVTAVQQALGSRANIETYNIP